MNSEKFRKRAKALEDEAYALWDEYYELVDAIDHLRWWQRPFRESDLRARLRSVQLQLDVIHFRRTSLGDLAKSEGLL